MKHKDTYAHRYVKHIWVGMVGDRLDWVRVLECGLEMGVRGSTWAGVGLN